MNEIPRCGVPTRKCKFAEYHRSSLDARRFAPRQPRRSRHLFAYKNTIDDGQTETYAPQTGQPLYNEKDRPAKL